MTLLNLEEVLLLLIGPVVSKVSLNQGHVLCLVLADNGPSDRILVYLDSVLLEALRKLSHLFQLLSRRVLIPNLNLERLLLL